VSRQMTLRVPAGKSPARSWEHQFRSPSGYERMMMESGVRRVGPFGCATTRSVRRSVQWTTMTVRFRRHAGLAARLSFRLATRVATLDEDLATGGVRESAPFQEVAPNECAAELSRDFREPSSSRKRARAATSVARTDSSAALVELKR
jgi:hypothetical protein